MRHRRTIMCINTGWVSGASRRAAKKLCASGTHVMVDGRAWRVSWTIIVLM